MYRRKHETLRLICYWLVKIFSLSLWSIIIVFTCHYLKIWDESFFYSFYYWSFRRIWIQRFSSFPIIFVPSFKNIMISYTMAWCLIYIS